MQLRVQPRVQQEAWSLYWKESLKTVTKCLDTLDLEVEPDTTGAQLLEQVAEKMGWPATKTLLRLEGFTEPWERLIFRGREIAPDAKLSDAGVSQQGCVVTVVRKLLKADGWKIAQPGDFLTDSEEEDDDVPAMPLKN